LLFKPRADIRVSKDESVDWATFPTSRMPFFMDVITELKSLFIDPSVMTFDGKDSESLLATLLFAKFHNKFPVFICLSLFNNKENLS